MRYLMGDQQVSMLAHNDLFKRTTHLSPVPLSAVKTSLT
jgi:hypothetical protein